jgi:hypothetical protein
VRQLWMRTFPRRSLVVVVAMSLITLGASSPIQSAPSRPHDVRQATVSPVAARADCGEGTARQLVNRYHLNNFLVPSPVAQVLCGPYTGAGSEAMAVTIGGAPTCWPIQRWAVFTFTGGDWKLVLDEPAFLEGPLVAVGSDLKETTPVYRLGDPRCIPSGGTQARLWHWDGRRLVAGAWTQVTPGKPLKNAHFNGPRAVRVLCNMSDDPSIHGPHAVEVLCEGFGTHPARYTKAILRGNGGISFCRTRSPSGCKLLCGCEENTPTLAYGKQVDVGRFRCESLRAALRCTVIRTGQGFLINKSRALRAGP